MTRINHVLNDMKKMINSHDFLLSKRNKIGKAWGADVLEALPQEKQYMILTSETFKKMSDIVQGFVELGRGQIPQISQEANNLLVSKDDKVKFLGKYENGIYGYEVEIDDLKIGFGLTPKMLPIFLYCVNDMMERAKNSGFEMPNIEDINFNSPISSIDSCVSPIKEENNANIDM